MLDPFAQLFQHCWGRARSLRMVYKDLWVVSFPRYTAGPNIVGSCCIRLHTTSNKHATTPNIVGATLLGAVASVCTQPDTEWNCCGVGNSSSLERLQSRAAKIVSKMSNSDKAVDYLKWPSLVNRRGRTIITNSLKDALKDTARNSLKTTSLLTDPYTIPLLGKLTGCTYRGFELTLLKTLYYNGCIISNKLNF